MPDNKKPIAMQNLGPVTSYAEAVAGGYTGTRDQYREDIAKLAENVSQVRADREKAEVAASSAVAARNSAYDFASAAENAAERAERSIANGAYMSVYIGEDGSLYFEKTENLTDLNLSIVNGDLIMEVTK